MLFCTVWNLSFDLIFCSALSHLKWVKIRFRISSIRKGRQDLLTDWLCSQQAEI
ncbi:hypothetical protein CLOSTMETH_01899 [[Clostridium] methylpentosum DSM 5476]|uniref:Uncharacterized protein n=1 Tax=[Clostridium] methylpentosum DSM 5476 TaxID=537013 RepID=C0EDH2_9FIRM|nr:hypothetical protein CLOSTMETH_01899 [[Clostridium] methylpentosum DSM 5476]